MRHPYACQSNEHHVARRRFLGQLGAGLAGGGLAALTSSRAAAAMEKKNVGWWSSTYMAESVS